MTEETTNPDWSKRASVIIHRVAAWLSSFVARSLAAAEAEHTPSDIAPTASTKEPWVLAVTATLDREMFVARFSELMITDVVQEFWAAMQQGDFITDAAEKVGTYRKMGARWLAASGGVRPRRGKKQMYE